MSPFPTQRALTFPYLPKRFFKSAALVLDDRPLTHRLRVELVLLLFPAEQRPQANRWWHHHSAGKKSLFSLMLIQLQWLTKQNKKHYKCHASSNYVWRDNMMALLLDMKGYGTVYYVYYLGLTVPHMQEKTYSNRYTFYLQTSCSIQAKCLEILIPRQWCFSKTLFSLKNTHYAASLQACCIQTHLYGSNDCLHFGSSSGLLF